MTLHGRITADIAAAIRSGAWPPGHRIPFETELAATYGCARATAGKAVQALVAAGLIERRRKAGSFVARPPIHAGVLEIPDIEAAIRARGRPYGFRQKSWRLRGAAGIPEAAALGETLLELSGIHLEDGRPFAFEHRLINLGAAPKAADVDFTRVSPGAWLLSHVAWSEARHEIAAVNPDLEVSEALGVLSSRACLAIKRWTWRVGVGITYARQVFPGDVLDLTATFTP
ncbi:MAG TPA: UTRA domain-containing protein [Caulobacteraceae bacterium]|nr:UTRA domain-containing protein [Caulobacteraceae bacterium]